MQLGSDTLKNLILMFAAMLSLAGCATPLTLEQSAPAIPATDDNSYLLSVIENRPYVLSGDKEPNYAGIVRGGFGIPHFVPTPDGKPLVDFLAERLAHGLKTPSGTVLVQNHTKPPELNEVADATVAAAANRGIAVRLREWRFDFGMFSWRFFYNLDIEIFDREGKRIAAKHFSGDEAPPWDGNDSPHNMAQLHYKRKFEEFFSTDELRAALQGSKTVSLLMLH